MGREVRRVPLDFNWPLDKVWDGFLNPHYRKCEACDGSGSTASAKALDQIVRMLMLAGKDSTERPADYNGRPTLLPNYPGAPPSHVHHFPHPFLVDMGIRDPGDTMHELTTGLAGRSPRGPFGHDACDSWSAVKKIREAAGLPETWGTCTACGGEGVHPEAKAAYEAWTETPPPTGDGWQVWETVSEGSPITPVFPTPEALAHHIATVGMWDKKTPYEDALRWIRGPGWAPSMMMVGGRMVDPIAEVGGSDA